MRNRNEELVRAGKLRAKLMQVLARRKDPMTAGAISQELLVFAEVNLGYGSDQVVKAIYRTINHLHAAGVIRSMKDGRHRGYYVPKAAQEPVDELGDVADAAVRDLDKGLEATPLPIVIDLREFTGKVHVYHDGSVELRRSVS